MDRNILRDNLEQQLSEIEMVEAMFPGTDEFHFCGSKQIIGKPYCLDHCMMAYRKKENK